MKNILVGITGSIAAYKSVLLIRCLTKRQYKCKIIISEGGMKFVTPQLVAGLGCEVYTDKSVNLADPKQAMLHINLAKWADLIMIAPASANFIAKIAVGLANDILSQVVLAIADKPCYIAPAMNYQMWKNAITQTNIEKLVKYNFKICYPNDGIQACGDIGEGRMWEAEQLASTIDSELNKSIQIFVNKTILITLGATVEPIDPVRFISNYSSGKMGLAIIEESLKLGAKVIALAGKMSAEMPIHNNLMVINTPTAVEMLRYSLNWALKADIFIACAAVSDYRISQIAAEKIKKTTETINIELIKNPDVLAQTKHNFPNLFCVGFAAETENLIPNAIAKLQNKNLDLIIANQVGEQKVFNQDTSQAYIINKELKINELPEQSKSKLAQIIMQTIGSYFRD